MTRARQLKLLARAALFAVPGVRLAQRPAQDGAELVIDLADDASADAWIDGSARILAAGLVKGQPFAVYAGEWRLAIRDVLAELQREADTADHGERPPVELVDGAFGYVYDVHAPGNPVVTCLAGDLTRTIGEIQKTGKPARVSARLARCVPSTVDDLDGVVREPIDDAQTQPYRPGRA